MMALLCKRKAKQEPRSAMTRVALYVRYSSEGQRKAKAVQVSVAEG